MRRNMLMIMRRSNYFYDVVVDDEDHVGFAHWQ